MKLEDYFNFLASDDIRLKGSRIGIETIFYEYIHLVHTLLFLQHHACE